MKKILVPLSIVTSCAIFAADIDTRISNLESQLSQISTQSYSGKTIPTNANAYPIVKDSMNIKLEIGAVYQTINVGSTNFALAYSCEGLDKFALPIPPIKAQILAPKSKLSWGVNSAASYVPFLSEYDIRFSNSYYENSSQLKKTTNNATSFIANFLSGVIIDHDEDLDFTSSF